MSLSCAVRKLFKPPQGEGAQDRRAAAFRRFAGRDLPSGRGADREAAAGRFRDAGHFGPGEPR